MSSLYVMEWDVRNSQRDGMPTMLSSRNHWEGILCKQFFRTSAESTRARVPFRVYESRAALTFGLHAVPGVGTSWCRMW